MRKSLLPQAVAAVREEVVRRRDACDRQMRKPLFRQQAEFERLKSRQFRHLELALSRSEQAQAFKDHRRAKRSQEINRIRASPDTEAHRLAGLRRAHTDPSFQSSTDPRCP